MKLIKIYQENGLIPVKANPSDSGFDVKSNGLTLVANHNRVFNEKYMLLTPGEFKEYYNDESTQKALICARLNSALNNLADRIVYSMFIEYHTGLKVILDKDTHIKGFSKSGKSIKAPLLGNLQNGVGVVDEHYRGEIIFKYELIPTIIYYLIKGNNIKGLASDIMNGIYLPSKTRSIGQIIIENRDNFDIEIINEWIPEYENTDRGTGGHDSTKS